MPQHNRFIPSFIQIPKDIFRVNSASSSRSGLDQVLGDHTACSTSLQLEGKYNRRLSTQFLTNQNLVRTVKPWGGATIYVYAIMAGIVLPNDLILVHEFRDHYSLQARKEMTVEGTRTSGYSDTLR
ncbi:hypothetical protein N7471_007257 [Penicillium samsonianum]|uniref:uncharacterized protein n=1 Tax=Penicillium samsonianum TaxID=1882272 RepID=UPI002546BA11|nr:uncharacterized protein N7471_007257 [Penicillium samsonianum]KAJ6132042.1 hypothetical protein N7471_007257 [Penicillium samsonianum]